MLGSWLAVSMTCAAQVGMPAPQEAPNASPLANAYQQYGFEGQSEQRYPFDSNINWVHGHYQNIPAYRGHPFYRPYNYKDVLSQSQTAAGWGMAPQMPYSQQFWHRYQDQATMLKLPEEVPSQTQTSQWSPRGTRRGGFPSGGVNYTAQPVPQGYVPQSYAPQGYMVQQPVFVQPTYSVPVTSPVMQAGAVQPVQQAVPVMIDQNGQTIPILMAPSN